MSAHLKAVLLTLCAVLLLASIHVRAEFVAIPALKARVTDLTQTLTPDQQRQLEVKLATFEQEKGSQIAVLIVPTTAPEDIAQYSIRVTDAWKLGREKQDDGVLLLIAIRDRKMRIEVGRGLEGAIPDLIAKRIITEVMTPPFKQGDFYGGINNSIDALMGLVSGEQLPAPASPNINTDNLENMLPLLFFGGVVLAGLLRAIFGRGLGGMLNAAAVGVLAWILGVGIILAIFFGILAFILTIAGGTGTGRGGSYGGGYRGSSSGGSSSSGSWGGGGGGSFGGGGASGSW